MLTRKSLFAAFSYLPLALNAAPITWDLGDIDGTNGLGDLSVSTDGTLIEAANFGSILSPTINSVTFAAVDFANGDRLTNLSGLSYNENQSGGGASGLGDIDVLLDTISFRRSDSEHPTNLTGLSIGNVYQVQFFLSFAINRTYSFDDLEGNSVTLTAQNPAQFVTGTFTADATTQAITLRSSEGSHVLNAYQVRQVNSSPIEVTTLSDELNTTSTEGTGLSLREALRDAESDSLIVFSPSLNGGLIQLNASRGPLVIGESLTIDASALPDGIAIDGGSNGDLQLDENETRCFFISDGDSVSQKEVTLNNLTIQNGVGESVFIVNQQSQGFSYLNNSVLRAGANLSNRENLTLLHCQILNGTALNTEAESEDEFPLFEGNLTSEFTNSESNGGGGIFSTEGTLTMEFCRVEGNRSFSESINAFPSGGGIKINFSSATLSFCQILNNTTVVNGGGIAMQGRNIDLTILNSTIAHNSSGSQGAGFLANGGGIHLSSDSNLVMENSTLSANTAEDNGGGLFHDSLRPNTRLVRCTLSGNSAGNNGGAYSSRFGVQDFIHCTIVNNSARNGGGIYSDIRGGIANNNPITLSACIVRDNPGGDLRFDTSGPNSFFSGGDNLIGTGATARFSSSEINTFPILLAPLANYGGPTETMPPLVGSPVIDAATASEATEDQRGFFMTNAPDIGAVEFQGEDDELELAFDTDGDGDGISVGLELAFGTDPFVTDFDNPNRPQMSSVAGVPTMSFGVDTSFEAFIRIEVERSETLLPSSFETVAFVEVSSFLQGGINFGLIGGEELNRGFSADFDFQIVNEEATFTDKSSASKAFYRFRRVKVEP